MIDHLKEANQVDLKIRKEAKQHFDFHSSDEGFKFQVTEIDEGYVYEENGVRVIPFRVNHLSMFSDEPCLGYRVEYQGKSLVICWDTCYCENLVEYSRGVDLLIHEVAAYPVEAVIPDYWRIAVGIHTYPEECARIFDEVKPQLAVYYHVLHFLGSSVESILERTLENYDGEVVIGEDMMEIEIGDTVRVLNR